MYEITKSDWKDAHWVSKKFNIKYETLKKQRQHNKGLPFHKFGKLVRYNTIEIQKYLNGEALSGLQTEKENK